MKVRIVKRKGTTYPLLFCEICDWPIDGSEPAEYLIRDVPDGKYTEPIVGHYRCTINVEKNAPRDVRYGNETVEHLLLCLVHNTKTNLKREARKATLLNSMV